MKNPWKNKVGIAEDHLSKRNVQRYGQRNRDILIKTAKAKTRRQYIAARPAKRKNPWKIRVGTAKDRLSEGNAQRYGQRKWDILTKIAKAKENI